jgi:hypothetical protein
MRAIDFKVVIDNSVVDRLVKEGFFEGWPGHPSSPSRRTGPNSHEVSATG